MSGSQLPRKAATSSTLYSDKLGGGTTGKTVGLLTNLIVDLWDMDGVATGGATGGVLFPPKDSIEGESIETRDEQELDRNGSKGVE